MQENKRKFDAGDVLQNQIEKQKRRRKNEWAIKVREDKIENTEKWSWSQEPAVSSQHLVANSQDEKDEPAIRWRGRN